MHDLVDPCESDTGSPSIRYSGVHTAVLLYVYRSLRIARRNALRPHEDTNGMGRVPKCLIRLSQRASRRTTGATPYVVLHIPYVGMFLAMRTCQDRQRHLKTAVWRAESPTRERICQMRPSVLPPATGFLAILPRLSPDGTACTMRHQQLNNLQRQDNKASNPHAVIGPVRRVGMRSCCGGRTARSHHKRSYCVHLGPGPPWCASLCPTVRPIVHHDGV